MKQQFLLLSLLLLFVACKDNASSNDPFAKTKMIKHTKVFSDNEPIFRGAGMLHFEGDNSLVLGIFKDDNYHLLKVNLQDNSTSYLIPIGNGPGEFANIGIVQPTSDSTFLFRDWNTAQLYEINVITGAIKKDYDFEGRCMQVVKMKDYHIATGIFDKGMFAVRDNKDSLHYVHQYPQDNIDDKESASKAMAYQGKLLSNKNIDRVMFCSSRFSYFEIFQFDGPHVSSIKKSYIGEFDYSISPTPGMTFAAVAKNNREGYVDAYVTSKNIYLLYSGRSEADAEIETREQASLSNQILVYDWDGNEVKRYETDVDLQSICVNKAESIIYAVSFNPDPEIVFFEL